jgi:hypothetical protein
MQQLSFTESHSYAGSDAGITVPVLLRSGERLVDLVASVDTGASHCLFETGYAAELGRDLTSGVLTRFRTAGIVILSLVYFFAEPAIRKNVLGRAGWLDRVRLGLVDYDRELYLAAHDHIG